MPVFKIENLKSKVLFPGFTTRIACLEQMMFSHWTIEKGAQLPDHHHANEQISILIEGQFEFTLEGEQYLIEPGMVVLIPAEAVHSGYALTDCKIIDIFYPIREDYREKMN